MAGSTVTINQVIVEMGYGNIQSYLDDHFDDVNRDIGLRIQEAEDEVDRLTGRSFNSNTSDWHTYNAAIKQLAAIKCLSVVLNNETTQLTYEIDSAIKVDKSERSRRLNSNIMRLQRNVDKLIDILKITESPQISVVTL
jgi:hypothetical protein